MSKFDDYLMGKIDTSDPWVAYGLEKGWLEKKAEPAQQPRRKTFGFGEQKPVDTRAFQQYDPSNPVAQKQIGSSPVGVVLPNNPYREEAKEAVLKNVAQAMTDPMLGVTTYHGSPTSGIRQFDLAYRGTGEGRLAADSPLRESFKDMIGHGLYSAESEGIGKGYQERLANQNLDLIVGGKPEKITPQNEHLVWQVHSSGKSLDNLISEKEFMAGRPTLPDNLKRGAEADAAILRNWKSKGGVEVATAPGSTYTSELLGHPDEYLQWDKPLSEQTKPIETAIDTYRKELHDKYAEYSKRLGKDELSLSDVSDMDKIGREYLAIKENIKSGKDLYRHLSRKLGSDKAASEYLASKGIAGIKYPAASGRSSTSNYVTFKPETDIVITHENQKRIPGAVEDAYKRMRDPKSKAMLERQYPELKGD